MKLHRRSMLGLTAAAVAAPVLGHLGASAQEATPAACIPADQLEIYLLTIPGTLAPATLDEAREMHNSTAGAPENIAAARSLGDVSHTVFASVTPPASGAGDILFIDYWTSIEGLNAFFANPTVQEQGDAMFASRTPTVWSPAQGFLTYNLPAPKALPDRFVVMVQGALPDREGAKMVHNQIVKGGIAPSRAAGDLSHEVFFKLAAPGEPESLDFLAIDVWTSLEGFTQFFAQPEIQEAFGGLFAAPPTVTVWTNPAGEWAEW
jgi:quinol monooxygenase YgiN